MAIHPKLMIPRNTKSINEDKSRDSIAHTTHAGDASAHDADKAMEAIDRFILDGFHVSQLCPWHTQQVTRANKHRTGLNPMQRFMAEAEGERGAVYYGAQEGAPSITRACTCATILSAAMNSTSKTRTVEQQQQRFQADDGSH